MELFELVIGLLLGAAVLTTFAQRIGVPFPVLLALGGTALALLPTDAISARLDPDLALALFVAPVLLDAGFDTSLRDLRANWRPISSLVIAAVGLTVAAVAVVAHHLIPDMPWAVAITLGAIVAPPDAVAATSVLRTLSPPYRLLVILEGESLLNDATALLIYRTALHAVGGEFNAWSVVPAFLLGSFGGIVLGYILAHVFLFLIRRLAEGAVAVVLQFVGTFAVWLIAERIGISSVLTVVVYAMTLARFSAQKESAEARMASFAVWDVAIYVLNALAFILMGLQLKDIAHEVNGRVGTFLVFSLAILLTVVLIRVTWVIVYSRYTRYRLQNSRSNQERIMPTTRGAFVVGWCGMRGIVTLATALALPFEVNGSAFPHRDLLIAASFTVVIGTLVLQGLTLGPMLRRFKLPDDGIVQREEVFARQEIARAAIDALDGETRPEANILRKEYNFQLKEDVPSEDTLKPHHFGRLRLRAIGAERQALETLRREQKIGDAAYQTVQEELDWAEGHAAHRKRAFSAQAPAEPEGEADDMTNEI